MKTYEIEIWCPRCNKFVDTALTNKEGELICTECRHVFTDTEIQINSIQELFG